jgi:hypothetical protein
MSGGGGLYAPPAGRSGVALSALAIGLARTTDGRGALARTLLGRLLVVTALLHLAENTFPLHLLLERPKRLVDVVVANGNLHGRWLVVICG